MPTRPEIFVSATTKDLGSCRQLVRDCILDLGCHPVVQNHFEPDTRTVRAMLRAQLAPCNAVVHIAGLYYGAEPSEREPGEPRRSYTQMEYDMAVEMGKPVYLFICGNHFPYDTDQPEGDPTKEELQRLHRETLLGVKQIRYRVSDPEELKTAILKLKDRVNILIAEMAKARRRQLVGLWMIAALLLLVAGAFWVVKHGVGEVKVSVDKMDGHVIGVDKKVGVVQDTVIGVDKKVDVVQDGVVGINTSLKAPSGGNGRLIVESDPPGATAFLKGERSTKFPIRVDLPHGRYSYTFHLLGYETEYRDVTLQSGEITDLGVIHFKPLEKKFDPNATYELEQINADVFNFLDREIWVNALINEKAPDLDFMAAGEGARYRYYTAMSTADNASGWGIMSKDNRTTWAIARLLPEAADKLEKDLAEERTKADRRTAAEDEAFLQKARPEDRGYLRHTRAQFRGRPDPKGRVKIRVDSVTYIAGGVDHNVPLFKFVCDLQAWDFTQADQQADKKSSAAVAAEKGPKLVISDDDGLGQALFGDGSGSSASAPPKAAPPPARSSPTGPSTSYVKGVPIFTAPPTPAAPSAALKADAKAADAELNAAYQQVIARSRGVDKNMVNQVIAIQRQWLAARDRIPDLAQQTAFVRQRTNTLRQQVATFDQKMREYDAQHRR